MSEDRWKSKLTPEQYHVLRKKGTEPPFSGKFLHHKENGMYTCVACGVELFKSTAKYDSSTPGLAGWPSFTDVASSKAVNITDDNSWGMHRLEVTCANCGGHLGHLFDDESSPNGKHYCINSCSLDFAPQKQNGQKSV